MFRVIILLMFILTAAPAFSQVKLNSTNNGKTLWQKNGVVINDSQGRSVRQNARSVTLDDNTSIIVWEDERNGLLDIYAQKFDSNGTKLWGKNGIGICESPKNQTFPQIISDGRSVIITWQDYRNGNADIYAQKMNLSGSTIWDKDGVPICRNITNQLAPQLASDTAGGAIITWYDYRSGKGEDIYAQKISKTGSAEWDADGIPVCAETGTQWYPKIIPDGSGGAIICWDDKRSDYYDIYAQRLDVKGNAVWQLNGIPICTAPENQEYSQIASCEKDTFALTWQDYRNRNADVYAQKINLDGRVLWKTNGEIVCTVAGNQEKPQIVEGKDPVIVWTDFRNGTGNSDIFCQKMSSAGKPLWDPYGVPVCEASGNQVNPKAVSDGNGGAIIAWQDQRSSASGIFARRVNNDGKALWSPDGKTVCSTSYSAEFPQMSISKNGISTITWQDKRNGGLGVYAQVLSLNGTELCKDNGAEVVFNFGSVTQQKQKITRTGKEEYLIVWEDYRNGYSNIYAQKINNNGKILWTREGLRVCSWDSNQYNPELVSDDAGGAIIVWEDTRSGISQIYAQRMDPYGNKLWDEGGIQICQADGTEINPKLTKDLNGGAMVAWQDSRRREGLYNIYAQRIGKDGALLWRADGVAAKSSEGAQMNLDINSDDEDGAIITWVEYRRNLNTPDIYAQRINKSGNILWTNAGLAVCRAPESQKNPKIVTGNSIIVAWEDSGGGNYDIYAQKLNKDGTIAWTYDGVPVCTAQFTQHEPKLILSSDGGAIFTWEDYRKANWDIFAQRIDPDGNQKWAKDGIEVCTTPGTQYAPQLVKSRRLSTIIVWEDYRNNESYNIYAQKLSDAGEALWEKDGVSVCVTEGGARNPQLADDGKNGAVIIWTDYRYGSYDIYAQRINEIEKE
ncbi:MAG: hypothetical protein ABH860_02560 [bacterium]